MRRLDLSWNGFGQESAECLAACLAANEGLVDLDLAGNRLNDEAMVMMSKGLKNNTILEKLVVSMWKSTVFPLNVPLFTYVLISK